jgi:hypothetical protein
MSGPQGAARKVDSMAKIRITGYEALALLREGAVDSVSMYQSPIEPARDGLTLDEAEDIAAEAHDLLYVDLEDADGIAAVLCEPESGDEVEWTVRGYTSEGVRIDTTASRPNMNGMHGWIADPSGIPAEVIRELADTLRTAGAWDTVAIVVRGLED